MAPAGRIAFQLYHTTPGLFKPRTLLPPLATIAGFSILFDISLLFLDNGPELASITFASNLLPKE